MNDGFFDVKLLFATPQSLHDSSPQGVPEKPLLEERWHEVTERRQKGRCGAVPYEVNAVFGRPMIASTNCIFFVSATLTIGSP